MNELPDLRLSSTPPGGTSHTRVTNQVAGWVSTSLARQAPLEDVLWDCSLQLVPTPQGPQPVMVVLLQMPAPILGQVMVQLVMVQWTDLSAEHFDTAVTQGVELLRQQRAAMLNPGNNGHGPHPGGVA